MVSSSDIVVEVRRNSSFGVANFDVRELFIARLFRALPFGGPDYSRFSLLYGNGKLLVV